ncbi:SCO family protein [Denitratisoma oestradiolicum]|uniref:Electron transporter SenC n=1 Tax=Denitratisoma oestradiolicum TaxID=311182 RepID=A0A6S6XVX3_9PROT|nr:SCO family protein [Denitratisoma oestradiolicum]TWO80342.1 electron transporter SenC [Denitratisoma oestradiolicum]CAB1370139.1 Electron transporter SenC [Denitratisoma oestradiolicum]
MSPWAAFLGLALSLVFAPQGVSAGPPQLVAQTVAPGSEASLTTLDRDAALTGSQAAVGRALPPMLLRDRYGKPVELSRLRGKPLLVNFIYTGCFQVCPTITRNLQKAVEGTVNALGAERFTIVSIGFNQPFDSPQAMNSYALQQGVRLPNWLFLSPEVGDVDALTAAFGFSFVQNAAGFDHLNQLTLVDGDGIIVRQIYGESFSADMLVEPLKALVVGSALPRQNAVTELLDRVRILCSVYDPKSGRYRIDYTLFMEIGGFLTFLAGLGYVVWRERRRKVAT